MFFVLLLYIVTSRSVDHFVLILQFFLSSKRFKFDVCNNVSAINNILCCRVNEYTNKYCVIVSY